MAQNKRSPRGANQRGPFEIVLLGGERSEDSPETLNSQHSPWRNDPAHWAAEYRNAARRCRSVGDAMGGRHGAILSRLADQYAQRASVLAGGLA